MRQPRYSDIFAGHDEGAAMAERAKVLWAEYKSDLVERGLWSTPRARIVDRLVRLTVEYLNYHPVALAEGPVKVGPNGGDVANMLWAHVWKMAEHIARLEKSLTLTPESVGEKVGGVNRGAVGKSAADEFLASH